MDDLRSALEADGYAVLPEYLAVADLADAVADIPTMYPAADEFHDDDPVRNGRFRGDQFGGFDHLPFASPAWNLLAVHPKLIAVAREALGVDDVRLYQAESWAKYTGAADYEQVLHCDYGNHSIVVPTTDPAYGQIEMFLYLSDVGPGDGPTAVVSNRWTRDLPAVPTHLDRDRHEVLAAHEEVVTAAAGTLLVYRVDTFHRAMDMTAPRSARYTLHLNFRTAAAEFALRRGWGHHANHPQWRPFVERLTPDQLAVFGFPTPGHPYWTAETLDGVQLRYPRLDLTPWRVAMPRTSGA